MNRKRYEARTNEVMRQKIEQVENVLMLQSLNKRLSVSVEHEDCSLVQQRIACRPTWLASTQQAYLTHIHWCCTLAGCRGQGHRACRPRAAFPMAAKVSLVSNRAAAGNAAG